MVKLSDLLPDEQVRVPLKSRTKTKVIEELLDLLPINDAAIRDAARDAVLNREAELTTGIGRGVAIPHGRSAAIPRHMCSFGIAHDPIDFDAIDGKPCRIFFLCVSNPNDTGPHIRVLSQMARVLNTPTARKALVGAADADQVRDVFLQNEGTPAA